MFAIGSFPFIKIGARESYLGHGFGDFQLEGALADLPFFGLHDVFRYIFRITISGHDSIRSGESLNLVIYFQRVALGG